LPQVIPSVDEIMARERRDMHFIRFGWPFNANPDHPSWRRHFDGFAANGLRWETAAPHGWLEGDPGVHAVHFDGPGDPRVALYSAEFEDGTGRSLDPDAYQMVLLPYAWWLDGSWIAGGEERPNRDGPR
jgi:hypothetical protein